MSDRYIIEREFEHAGYKCVVALMSMGHRCGYVGIPKEHPLYGKGYDDYLEIKKSDIGDREVSGAFPLLFACLDKDERVRIEAYFQCHGGITFADGGENSDYPIESDLWWFGFDCNHAGDKPDLMYAMKKFPNKREEYIARLGFERSFPISDEIIRTEGYVAKECERLAEQLKEFVESEEN